MIASVSLPTQDQLPCDDGVPMETQRHKLQMDILIEVLFPWLEKRADGYVSGNMFIYFSASQVRNQDFKGPDFFAVLGVPKTERKSWVVWEEGKGPDVVIELLSESTATIDKTEKKEIYQDKLRVPEYFWYDPFNPADWAGFVLKNGVYHPITPDADNRFISEQLNLALIIWQGEYRGVNTTWLRWATLEGEILPTGQELAQYAQQNALNAKREALTAQQEAENAKREALTAQQEAENAQEKAQQVEQKAERLATQLRAMGINPDDL